MLVTRILFVPIHYRLASFSKLILIRSTHFCPSYEYIKTELSSRNKRDKLDANNRTKYEYGTMWLYLLAYVLVMYAFATDKHLSRRFLQFEGQNLDSFKIRRRNCVYQCSISNWHYILGIVELIRGKTYTCICFSIQLEEQRSKGII